MRDVARAFPTEKKGADHLVKIRWPDRIVCPRCGCSKRINRLRARSVWWCGDCRKQFSERIGTVFEGSRVEFRKWFMAIWLLADSKKEVSPRRLAQEIEVTPKTAGLMISRLREAMPRLGNGRGLFGVAEAESENGCRSRLSFGELLSRLVHQAELITSAKIIRGDCLEELKKIEPDTVHLVVTDPPYFLDGLDCEWKKGKPDAPRATGVVGGLPVGMKFDPEQGRKLQKFIGEVGKSLMSVMVPGGFAVFFSQPRLSHRMAVGLEDAGFEIRDILAWHFTRKAQFKAFSMDHFVDRMDMSKRKKKDVKRRLMGRKTPQLRPQFEAMVLAQKPREGTFVNNWLKYRTGLMNSSETLNGGSSPSSVMSVEKPGRESYNGHLTVKPVSLVEHLIKLFSISGQVVLDPFLGSGTTLVAAENTGRSCIGIEINKSYVEIAENRLRENSVCAE